MSRDAKMFILGIVGFYALGVLLCAFAYITDNSQFFILVMTFWIKATVFAIIFGMAYWLYCIITNALGWNN
jgi:hypothetical protein